MSYGLDVDIDSVLCVDTGHHWEVTWFGRVPSGKLKGLPCRALVCSTCDSSKIEKLNWRGQVTSRMYDHEDAYIDTARMLGDHNARRRNLRIAMAQRLKKEGEWGQNPWEGDE